jgi:hypothetical protein
MSQPSKHGPIRTLTAFVLVIWFLLVLIASLLGAFKTVPSQYPLLLQISLILPVLMFIVVWPSLTNRQHPVLSLDLRVITWLHFGRIIGMIFLILYFLGSLPAIFGIPAGIGDLTISLTAPLVARTLGSKAGSRLGILALWNALGMLEIVMAFTLGTLTSNSLLGLLAGAGPGARTSQIMVAFPLSLIPAFFVPFYLILHLIALYRVQRTWRQ